LTIRAIFHIFIEPGNCKTPADREVEVGRDADRGGEVRDLATGR
jgi:hypothetical protein